MVIGDHGWVLPEVDSDVGDAVAGTAVGLTGLVVGAGWGLARGNVIRSSSNQSTLMPGGCVSRSSTARAGLERNRVAWAETVPTAQTKTAIKSHRPVNNERRIGLVFRW